MWNNFKTLFWLERKRLLATGRYWTRLIGFDADASRGYQFYVALFWAFWIFAMWAYAVEQAYQASRALDAETTNSLIVALPTIIALLQLIFLAITLRDFPLKLRGADLAYVITAPVSRGILALLTMIRALLLPAFVAGLLGSLVSMALSWGADPELVGMAGVQGLLLAFALTYLTGAFWWAIALFKAPLSLWARRAFWLLIPLLLLLGFSLLQVMTVPGQLWTLAIGARATAWIGLLLVMIAIAGAALVIAAGNRLHGVLIMQHSAKFARIEALGVWGRIYARDVIQRIEYQTRMAERHEPPRLRLPANVYSQRLLYWHTLLLLFRSGFLPILTLVAEGLLLTLLLAGVILVGGWQAPQTWLIVGLILLQRRPARLVQFYKQTLNGNFLRQFIPGDLTTLFFGTTYAPILLVSFGAWMGILLLPAIPALPGMLLALLVTTIFALCQALEWVDSPIFGIKRLSYEYSLAFAGIVVVAAGVFTGTLMAPTIAALGVNALLLSMLHG